MLIIAQETKINKVLKGITKLSSIPSDEKFNFKKRATELLTKMNVVLNDGEAAPATEKTLAVGKEKDIKKPAEKKNGVKVDEAVKEAKDDPADEKEKEAEKKKDEPLKEASKKEDIEMKDTEEKEAEGETEKAKVTASETIEASA